MGTLLRVIPSAGALGAAALVLSSVCAAQVAGNRASGGVPESHDTAEWTPAMPLTGRAIKCKNGSIKGFACENVELLSYLPGDSLGKAVGYDLWGWHDSTTGREFLIIGGDATAFVEVTDPVNPRYLGVLPPYDGAESHAAQSVKVYQHYAFIGYERPFLSDVSISGLQIFDLTQLRDVKSPREFRETAHYDGNDLDKTHTIALDPATGFAYANGSDTCGGGLHMIDVRTPTKPTFAGCYSSGYVHDAQCVVYRGPDQQYRGREICVNYMKSELSIVDVTDKQHPKTISTATYPNVGLVHQGWFTEDQQYIFVDDEGDEGVRASSTANEADQDSVHTRTIAFDLRDLDDPVVLTEFYNPNTRSTDHNLYIRGRYMYQGNYESGLRIIDIADPKQPKEVGYLSRKPGDQEGPWAWGPYPYFKNDVVAVSMSTGLVLARLLKR